jgi:hypothetical protein
VIYYYHQNFSYMLDRPPFPCKQRIILGQLQSQLAGIGLLNAHIEGKEKQQQKTNTDGTDAHGSSRIRQVS